MKAQVRLGYSYSTYDKAPGDEYVIDTIIREAQAAEAAGFDSLWMPDHLMQTPVVAPKHEPMLECYTTLGALAAATSTVRLGAFVGAAAYRNPALLGKMVTTLDVISRGRAIFGIGAGWFEEEHRAYGYEMGTIGQRFERLVDVLDIVESMFRKDETTHDGRHFRADGALNVPPPVQSGGPPILIGGSGEKRTLRLVAERADICNVTGTPERVRHLMSVLDGHCAAVGRDPATICRTFVNMVIVRDSPEEALAAMPDSYRGLASHVRPIMGTPDQVVEHFRALFAAGVDGLVVSCTTGDRTPEYVALLAELAARARG